MAENLIERYLGDLAEIRGTRANVPETSFYPALERLLSDIGKTLSPKVRCVVTIANRGAGLPDAGFFSADQFRRLARDPDAKANPFLAQNPSRGVLEAKPPAADIMRVAESEQVGRYWKRYGVVLVTNFRAFVLIGKNAAGQPAALEAFSIADSEAEFWRLTAQPRKTALAQGERLTEYLKRVLLHNAPLAAPQDVAAILASYAHDARVRIEQSDLPALSSLRQALEDALGLHFKDEKGEHFFRSTLIQTLFYGVFSAWVLWARRQGRSPVGQAASPVPDWTGQRPVPQTPFSTMIRETVNPYMTGGTAFDWRSAHWLLRVPMLRALFVQVADPARLGALGLVEPLDWAAAALNRVNHTAFFAAFDEGHAVQYFYEPFLHAFDPALRKELGVWYTPDEIVRYQVERVDTALRTELGLADGLADPNVVVLDPCCGTGAYLRAVLRRIAATLHEKGGDALVAHDLKKAAMERVFGFEILPAPFVIAHLQLGLELETLGAPLGDLTDPPERAGVYLTNALTGWEPPKEKPKQIAFPGFDDERDAAGRVKREKPILVVIGNPPYNGFAGVSPEEENGLVEPYKEGLVADWGIKKFNLDDLYIRFFRLAEKRIAEHGGRGVVSFISNHSWISDPSFVVLRRHLLNSFDRFWIENMHGNRKISEYAPDGKTSQTVFAIPGFSEGIQQGVAISLWVKHGKPLVGQAASPVLHGTGQRPVPQTQTQAQPGQPILSPPRFQPVNPYGEVEVSRRHLPHLRQPGATYFLTWRLADSLPVEKWAKWRYERDAWMRMHPQPWDDQQCQEFQDRFAEHLEDWLDQGMGECLLRSPTVRGIVVESLHHFNGDRYDLWHYAIMPNHVHVLVTPRPDHELSDLLHTWKGYTAKSINRLLKREGSVWQDETYDRMVRDRDELRRIMAYIEENPAKAGLSAQTCTLATVDWQAANLQFVDSSVGQAAPPVLHWTGQRPVPQTQVQAQPQVRFRDDINEAGAVDRRAHLLATLEAADLNAAYELAEPTRENRWSFRPSDVSDAYMAWPKLTELCEVAPSNGLMEKRGGALMDYTRDNLASRMSRYFDKKTSFAELKAEGFTLTHDAARYDAEKARQKLLASENFNDTHVLPYLLRPFDLKWCYYTPVRPIWNEPRPSLWAQCWEGNRFLLSRFKQSTEPEGVPFYVANGLNDDHLLSPDAAAFSFRLKVAQGVPSSLSTAAHIPGLEPTATDCITANLSAAARAYLASLGLPDPDTDRETAELIWYHALAIGYSPAYLAENADGIRQDWPRIPLPGFGCRGTGGLACPEPDPRGTGGFACPSLDRPAACPTLLASAALGREVAALLDVQTPVPGVTCGAIREELKSIAVFRRLDGKPARPDAGDLDLTAGWGHAGKGGVTMPGKGKLQRSEADGQPAYDIFLNEACCWRHVPEAVWNYTIGGYQVIKKWLSYREKPLLGRGLTPEEVRHITETARRLAALLALNSALDKNYRTAVSS